MKGLGGPLLSVGDLLQDLSEDAGSSAAAVSPSPTVKFDSSSLPPSHLLRQFEEAYDQLTKSLEGSDHSWTQQTLQLCAAVEAANKLISLAQSNAEILLEKLENLEIFVNLFNDDIQQLKLQDR